MVSADSTELDQRVDDAEPARFKTPSVFLLGLVLLVSGCGSTNGDAEPALPETTNEIAPQVSDSIEASETVSSRSTTTATIESAAGQDSDFVPETVRFDPDNPPDQSELEELVFQAVEADFSNLLWCWENADSCDLRRDLGPAIAEPREIEIGVIHSQFLADGALYTRSELDAVYLVEVLASSEGEFTFGPNNSFRALGAVSACEVFAGPYFVPARDGQPERLLNDDALSYIVEYYVWQSIDGVLRVANRSVDEQGSVEGCDSWLP